MSSISSRTISRLARAHHATLTRPTVSRAPRPHTSLVAPASSRSASGYYPTLERKPKKGVKIGHVFAALALLGIGATSLGLYDFYQSYTTFPSPIRTHLRAALRSQATSQFPRAEQSFEQAYNLAVELALQGQLGTREQALLRTTGILARWGGMWEEAGETSKAVEVYQRAFEAVKEVVEGQKKAGEEPTQQEKMRGVSFAMKIGDLLVLQGSDAKAEDSYTYCVTELMRMRMTPEQLDKVKVEMEGDVGIKVTETESMAEGKEEDEDKKDLPAWLGEVELVAALERLGELYARLGKVEFARPLLQQAIASLLPPPPRDGSKGTPPPWANRCHAATLMNNLSNAIVSAASPSATAIDESARWARQSLTVANGVRKEAEKARAGKVVPLLEREEAECEMVAIVGSYNLGKLSELAKDKVSARAWFEKSKAQSAKLGLRQGVAQSEEAIRRLQ